MVTVENIKNYLLLPSEVTSDDNMIQKMLDVSKVYLKNAVDNFDDLYGENEDFTKQADLFICLYCSELYQNRNLFNANGGNAPTYMTRSLMLQLQTYVYEEEVTE